MINIVSGKDIGDKFQDRRLSDASLSNKKDRVRRVRLVLRRLDDPMPKRLYIAKITVRTDASKMWSNSLNSRGVTRVRSGLAWASRITHRFVGEDLVTGSSAIRVSGYPQLQVMECLTASVRHEQPPMLLGRSWVGAEIRAQAQAWAALEWHLSLQQVEGKMEEVPLAIL